MSSQHVIIFEGRYIDEWGIKRLITIESSSTKGVIRRGPDETFHGYMDPAEYPDADLEQNMGCLPYSFKTDSTPPEINICGVEDSKIYANPVTISFTANDSIKTTQYDPYAFAETEKGEKILTNLNANNPGGIQVPKEKTFTREGTHTISFYAEDWAKNLSRATCQFTISNKWCADLKILYRQIAYTTHIPLFSAAGRSTSAKHLEDITEVLITSDELKRDGQNFKGKIKIKAKETLIHYSEGCPGEDCSAQNYEKLYPQITADSTWEFINQNTPSPRCRITIPSIPGGNSLPFSSPITADITTARDKSIFVSEISADDEQRKEITGRIYQLAQ